MNDYRLVVLVDYSSDCALVNLGGLESIVRMRMRLESVRVPRVHTFFLLCYSQEASTGAVGLDTLILIGFCHT